MLIASFAQYSILAWHLWSLIVYRPPAHVFLDFRVSIQNSVIILIDLPLYVTWSFSLGTFNILLFCTFSNLIIVCYRDIFPWSNLLCTLYTYCTSIDIFFKLGKFFSMIGLKIFAFDLPVFLLLPLALL